MNSARAIVSAFPRRPFTAPELDQLAITRPRLRAALESGEVLRPFRGVFLPAGIEDTQEVRAAALGKGTAPHHVICDRSAAWIHGVDTFALAEKAPLPVVEVCALRGNAPTRLTGGIDARTRDLLPADITTINGTLVTTPLRTALDLACNLRRREAMAALNDFARLPGGTRRRLERELPRFKGRRGVRQARELIALIDPRFESPREAWVMLAIHDAGLPTPRAQHWIEIDGVRTYRLDFAYPLARVTIEYDGEEFHKTPEQRAYDEERRTWLRNNGWTVIVVRNGDFTGDNLDRWLRAVREALTPTYTTRRF